MKGLPVSEEFPPDATDTEPDYDMHQGNTKTDTPPGFLRNVTGAEIYRGRTGTKVGQAAADVGGDCHDESRDERWGTSRGTQCDEGGIHAGDMGAHAGEEIMAVQQEISYDKNLDKVGQTFRVLVDKKEAGKYIGRTEFDSVDVDNEVIITSKKPLKIGEFVQVKIQHAYDYDLEGEVV